MNKIKMAKNKKFFMAIFFQMVANGRVYETKRIMELRLYPPRLNADAGRTASKPTATALFYDTLLCAVFICISCI